MTLYLLKYQHLVTGLGLVLMLVGCGGGGRIEPAPIAKQLDHAAEFRGLWVDAWHEGIKDAAQVDQLVARVREVNCNALIVQVRKRGDAYYAGNHEPMALELEPGFDPLARILQKAHDTALGRRLEVHAWLSIYPACEEETLELLPPKHVVRLHPEWLTKNANGQTRTGQYHALDPGHPGVQSHLFRVVLDLASRYDIDGLHLDYIRYPGREWGYNAIALERYQKFVGNKETPVPDDPQWMQFRRDQVSALVRKIYIIATAQKPRLKVSAATIAWAPGIDSVEQWKTSSAWGYVFQDWLGWLDEGILDMHMPMLYFRHDTTEANDWQKWITFVAAHSRGRHVAPGLGLYRNSVDGNLAQMRSLRQTTEAGARTLGMALFSYANTNTEGKLPVAFFERLVNGEEGKTPLFGQPASIPVMPWKRAPSFGILVGMARDMKTGHPLDGARLRLRGPVDVELTSDATGWFGRTRLPPGIYHLENRTPDTLSIAQKVKIRKGLSTEKDLRLQRVNGAG